MKNLSFLFLILILAFPTITVSAAVRGHWKDTDRDGLKDTYIQPYQRSSPNSTLRDNYNYPGNYNPNSGSFSTGNPYNFEESHRSRKNRYGR
ncbi:MAG: hypothetical protein AB1585_13355 [Thermodesulfobacteriota bacterium]